MYTNLKQKEAQSTRAKSTHKGANFPALINSLVSYVQQFAVAKTNIHMYGP